MIMQLNYYQNVINKFCLDEFEQIIDSFEKDLSERVSLQEIVEEPNYINILIQTAGNTIVTTREVLCLCASGYADGALGLARRLYEHFIILTFFALNEHTPQFQKIIEDYYLDYERISNKHFQKQARRLAYNNLDEQIREANEKIKEQAHHDIRAGNYWWTGHGSFERLSEVVYDVVRNERESKIYVRMHSLYSRACASLHPTSFSNTWRLSMGSHCEGINTTPSEKGHAFPLELTVLSLIQIIGIVLEKLNVDIAPYIDKLNKLGTLYVRMNNEQDSII